MGLIFAPATLNGPKGRASIKFLVDTGGSYTVLPHEVWLKLGLRPFRELTFTLADGTEVRRSISECRIQLRGLRATTPVVLGERTDSALLGTITLEILGLMLNPFSRTIEPMKMMLASHRMAASYFSSRADAAEGVSGARAAATRLRNSQASAGRPVICANS